MGRCADVADRAQLGTRWTDVIWHLPGHPVRAVLRSDVGRSPDWWVNGNCGLPMVCTTVACSQCSSPPTVAGAVPVRQTGWRRIPFQFLSETDSRPVTHCSPPGKPGHGANGGRSPDSAQGSDRRLKKAFGLCWSGNRSPSDEIQPETYIFPYVSGPICDLRRMGMTLQGFFSSLLTDRKGGRRRLPRAPPSRYC